MHFVTVFSLQNDVTALQVAQTFSRGEVCDMIRQHTSQEDQNHLSDVSMPVACRAVTIQYFSVSIIVHVTMNNYRDTLMYCYLPHSHILLKHNMQEIVLL